MFEDCPFNYALTGTKWVYFFVKSKSKLKKIILIINIIHILVMTGFVITHRNDKFDSIILPIYAWDTWVSVIVSISVYNLYFLNKSSFQANVYLILCRGDDIQDIMKYIDKAYSNIMENENEAIQQILISQSIFMKRIFQFFTYFFGIFFVLASGSPFVDNQLTCRIYIPGVDEALFIFNTPLFWFFYTVQFFLMLQALETFKFYILLVVNFIQFGTTLMQILKLKVRALVKLNEETKHNSKLNEELTTCIKFHLEIKEFDIFLLYLRQFLISFSYRYVTSINNLTKNIIFTEMFISSINLSFFLFIFGSSESSIKAIFNTFIVFYNLLVIWLFCSFADRLTYEVL